MSPVVDGLDLSGERVGRSTGEVSSDVSNADAVNEIFWLLKQGEAFSCGSALAGVGGLKDRPDEKDADDEVDGLESGGLTLIVEGGGTRCGHFAA